MNKVYLVLISMLFSTFSFSQEKKLLTINFDGLNADNGKLYVAVYNNEKDFLENPIDGRIIEIINGRAEVTFDNLHNGFYAASAFYDENNNGKLDTNFLGIPKEPIAISNNVKRLFGPPKYKDAKFKITNKKTVLKISF